MNTLNKSITTTFFNSPEDYDLLQEEWANVVNSEAKDNFQPSDYLFYAVLRGKDWTKMFTKVTNNRKLLGDPEPWRSAINALTAVRYGYYQRTWVFENVFKKYLAPGADLLIRAAMNPKPGPDILDGREEPYGSNQ